LPDSLIDAKLYSSFFTFTEKSAWRSIQANPLQGMKIADQHWRTIGDVNR